MAPIHLLPHLESYIGAGPRPPHPLFCEFADFFSPTPLAPRCYGCLQLAIGRRHRRQWPSSALIQVILRRLVAFVLWSVFLSLGSSFIVKLRTWRDHKVPLLLRQDKLLLKGLAPARNHLFAVHLFLTSTSIPRIRISMIWPFLDPWILLKSGSDYCVNPFVPLLRGNFLVCCFSVWETFTDTATSTCRIRE